MKTDGVFNCDCCLELFPSLYQHVHHKIPTSTGGPDVPSNLANLCPGCHDALHNIAYKLLSPTHSQSKTLDLLNIIYKDNEKAKKTCLELAQHVRDSVIVSKEKGLSPDHLVSIGCVLRKADKDVITVYCRGLQISQEDFILTAILKEVCQLRGEHPTAVRAAVQRTKYLKKARKT